jgi:hypothetical protein
MSGISRVSTGPLLDGYGSRIAEQLASEITEDLGQLAYDMIRQRLASVLVNPSGYYESRVQVSNASEGTAVDDGGVVYGPWLEGTGSRNGRSRFKGYATFRKVTQEIDARARDEAEKLLDRELRRFG